MKTLTDRKIAEQEKVTYFTQMEAQTTKQALEQATALAATQARVVDAERSVTIAEFGARATVKRAEGEAEAKKVQATADAMVTTTVGNAEAGKTRAIGTAEAEVTKAKIDSMEAGNFAAVQIAKALAEHNIKLVPEILVSGGGGGNGTLVDVLLANMIRDQLSNKGVGKSAVTVQSSDSKK